MKLKLKRSELRTISRAATLLMNEAICLRASYTIAGKWDPKDKAAKAAYDEMIDVMTGLRAITNDH